MGVLINPGNEAFAVLNRSSYVDKTGVIKLINQTLETRHMLSCLCLPSGFGKSSIAKMLAAYYDRSCDSHSLFNDKKIAESDDYEEKLNKYNVLYVDMNYFAYAKENSSWDSYSELIRDSLAAEFLGDCSSKRKERFESVEDNIEREMINVVERSDRKFVVIIDGWDVALRGASIYESDVKEDLCLANTWFDSATFTSKAVAGVVLTGALPFRKDVFPLLKLEEKSPVSVPLFKEYSLAQPGPFAEYFGFNEEDVRKLAGDQNVDELKRKYGGYAVENVGTVYNPASTLRALEEGRLDAFWAEPYSSSATADFIANCDDRLDETVAYLLGGASVDVKTLELPHWFKGKPDSEAEAEEFLALMIYLGYLTYDAKSRTAKVPNEEVKRELRRVFNLARIDR